MEISVFHMATTQFDFAQGRECIVCHQWLDATHFFSNNPEKYPKCRRCECERQKILRQTKAAKKQQLAQQTPQSYCEWCHNMVATIGVTITKTGQMVCDVCRHFNREIKKMDIEDTAYNWALWLQNHAAVHERMRARLDKKSK